MATIQGIFREHAPAYLEMYGERMPRNHRKIIDAILSCRTERFIGGDVSGFFGVLHTWGRTLNYHPHIHYVVAGGAWSRADNAWHPSRPCFYVPNKALSRIYRAKFRDMMRDADMSRLIDSAVFRDGWNVNIQPVGAG